MERVAIEDHGIIGDGRSAALVTANGTIDWLCWPRFDSDATFAALLHDDSAGSWILRPRGDWTSTQRYLEDTNVLVTEFVQDGGRVTLTDLMPVSSEEEARKLLVPEHEIVRVVQCTHGDAEIETFVRLAPGFGRQKLRGQHRGTWGLCVETRTGAFFLRGQRRLEWRDDRASATFRLRAGERVRFSLIWSPEGPAVLPPLGDCTDQSVDRSIRFWRSWVSSARYEGPYREAVRRSALVLKLLQYPPSGALLAAPTTSLPERPGGDLNWDYRYCWLRDAAFTARCLYGLGYRSEADAFVFWLMHTTGLTQPRLSVLYDVYGNSPGKEAVVSQLGGYGGARPVRTGNAAEGQLQLDLHGELIDAVCAYVDAGGELDRESRKMLRDFGGYIAHHWQTADASLWEDRAAPRQYTHSKVLCWSALEGLLRLHRQGLLPRLDARELAGVRDLIQLRVLAEARNPLTGGYVSELGGDEPDAALLLLPWYGFDSASSLRMRATLEDIRNALGAGKGLLHRNRSLRAAGDGAFLACSFWGVELVADGAGALAEAESWFQELLGHASALGLFAEEVDPLTGRALGNYPQAYSHVGLINAALAIEERRARTWQGAVRRRPSRARPAEARA